MEFLVHMAVGRIDAGEEREKQLRQEEAARSRELARQGNTGPPLARARQAGELGHLECGRLRPTPQCVCLIAALPVFDRLPYIPWHPIPTTRWHTPQRRKGEDLTLE